MCSLFMISVARMLKDKGMDLSKAFDAIDGFDGNGHLEHGLNPVTSAGHSTVRSSRSAGCVLAPSAELLEQRKPELLHPWVEEPATQTTSALMRGRVMSLGPR